MFCHSYNSFKPYCIDLWVNKSLHTCPLVCQVFEGKSIHLLVSFQFYISFDLALRHYYFHNNNMYCYLLQCYLLARRTYLFYCNSDIFHFQNIHFFRSICSLIILFHCNCFSLVVKQINRCI